MFVTELFSIAKKLFVITGRVIGVRELVVSGTQCIRRTRLSICLKRKYGKYCLKLRVKKNRMMTKSVIKGPVTSIFKRSSIQIFKAL